MVINIATKVDKKVLLKFYKSQHYSAKFMGLDNGYFIKNENTDEIIASVIISKITTRNHQYFLHALVVDPLHQKKGLATALITYASALHQPIVCFADKTLSTFYQQAGMQMINTKLLNEKLSAELSVRYDIYSSKNKSLAAFMV
jgi:GNAT superfamily N-acetyltransferase